jgi:hypothetical protein
MPFQKYQGPPIVVRWGVLAIQTEAIPRHFIIDVPLFKIFVRKKLLPVEKNKINPE